MERKSKQPSRPALPRLFPYNRKKPHHPGMRAGSTSSASVLTRAREGAPFARGGRRSVADANVRALRAASWSCLAQRRCTQLAAALRATERATTGYLGRERDAAGTWHVFARDADGRLVRVAEVRTPHAFRFADHRTPPTVLVLDEKLVDVESLALRLLRINVPLTREA